MEKISKKYQCVQFAKKGTFILILKRRQDGNGRVLERKLGLFLFTFGQQNLLSIPLSVVIYFLKSSKNKF